MPITDPLLKDIHKITGYAEFKQAVKQHLKVDRFFNQLDKIRSSILSDAEKRKLSSICVYCIINDDTSALEDSERIDGFIEALINLKNEVGMEYFLKLVNAAPSGENARIKNYITISQLLLSLNSNSDIDLDNILKSQKTEWESGSLLQIIEKLQAVQKQTVKIDQTEIDETITAFSTISELVKFPLDSKELELIASEYKFFKEKSLLLSDCTPSSLQQKLGDLKEKLAIFGKVVPEKLNEDYLELLAIIANASGLCFSKTPYITQMFAILGILKDPKGRLAQIRTGEGKSLTLAVLAAFFGCLGIRVHVITTSEDLASEHKNYKAFYDLLMLSSIYTKEGDGIKKYDQMVIYGVNTTFEFIFLRNDLSSEDKMTMAPITMANPCVGVVDEVDNFFIDTIGNSARISHPGYGQRTWFYKPILDFVTIHGNIITVKPENIRMLKQYLSEYENFKYVTSIEKFSDIELSNWLTKASEAQYKLKIKVDYVVSDGKIEIVDFENTGDISKNCRWNRGLHQFVEVKEGIEPKPETYTIAAMSHPVFFRKYTALFSMSGTAGDVTERDEVKETFGISSFDVPPHRPSLRKTLPALLCKSKDEHNEALITEIQTAIKDKRPILLLFISISASEEFSNLLKQRKIAHKLLNKQQSEDKEYIIRLAGYPGSVTIATNVAARGTDFILPTVSLQRGGFESVFTFYPANERVEQQGYGRAGRQGQIGSCRMILEINDRFIKEIIPSESDRESLADDHDFLDILDSRRTAHIIDLSNHRKLQAKRDEALYDVFNLFSTFLKYCYNRIESMSFIELAEHCAKISGKDKLPEIKLTMDPLFYPLQSAALSSLAYQEKSIGVDWLSLLEKIKVAYFLYLKQSWAKYFTDVSNDSSSTSTIKKYGLDQYKTELHDSFYGRVIIPLEPLLKDPQHGFINLMSAVLGVNENYFSKPDHAYDPNFSLFCMVIKKDYTELRKIMKLNMQAVALAQNGELKEAEDIFTNIITHNDNELILDGRPINYNYANVYTNRAHVQLKQGQYGEAIEDATIALKLLDNIINNYLGKGSLENFDTLLFLDSYLLYGSCLSHRDYKCRDKIEAASKELAGDTCLIYASCLSKQDKIEEAVDLCTRALSFNPKRIDVLYERAGYCLRLSKVIDGSFKLKDGKLTLTVTKELVCVILQYRPMAKNDLNTIIELQPSAENYFKVAQGMFQLLEYDRAVICFDEAIKKDETNSRAWYLRAATKTHINAEPEDIKKDYQTAVQLDSGNFIYHKAYINYLISIKDYESAIEQLKNCLKRTMKDSELSELVDIHNELKEKTDGKLIDKLFDINLYKLSASGSGAISLPEGTIVQRVMTVAYKDPHSYPITTTESASLDISTRP